MKNLSSLFFLASILLLSCGGSVNKIFGKKSLHEAYADRIDNTPAGQQWIMASKAALVAPHDIKLPYRQHGYFDGAKSRALALRFSARKGERVLVELNKKTAHQTVVFADLYRWDGTTASHLLEADTSISSFAINADEAGEYVVRVLAGLAQEVEYDLTVVITPSLGFPVVGSKARAGSFWGANRDGGKRSHEGVDIFAPKLTPAVAAADGLVTAVREGGIGGKTVWMKVMGRDINLYYAHLDKQLVSAGQLVRKGDTLGLVGNTGNAQHTPAHLHFGIYGNGGAVDPWPFVNQQVKEANAPLKRELKSKLVVNKSIKGIAGSMIPEKTILQPMAVTSNGYLAELPDGSLMQVPFSAVKIVPADRTITKATRAGTSTAG